MRRVDPLQGVNLGVAELEGAGQVDEADDGLGHAGRPPRGAAAGSRRRGLARLPARPDDDHDLIPGFRSPDLISAKLSSSSPTVTGTATSLPSRSTQTDAAAAAGLGGPPAWPRRSA